VTLREVLEAAAAEADPDAGVQLERVDGPGGGVTWSVDGRVVALVTPDDMAAFLLDPVIAQAAARTPGATASGRGPGWVELRVPVVDPHTVDRAEAWFAAALRRAAPPR
jgi:hypothetical protein